MCGVSLLLKFKSLTNRRFSPTHQSYFLHDRDGRVYNSILHYQIRVMESIALVDRHASNISFEQFISRDSCFTLRVAHQSFTDHVKSPNQLRSSLGSHSIYDAASWYLRGSRDGVMDSHPRLVEATKMRKNRVRINVLLERDRCER